MLREFLKNNKKPLIVLAPMAGYTESPFRRLIRGIEPSTILVSELISVEALIRGSERTFKMIEFSPDEKNFYGVQLFGGKVESFIQSAKILEDLDVDFIDINLGCPSPKVVGSGYGSALLKDIESTADMITQLVKSTKLPVTVKMRLGFYDDEDLVETAKKFEAAGISWLAIHGRTTKQKFTGSAEWEKIYEVKKNVKIPIIGNGDVTSARIAQNRLQNLDGVMIGRAAMKNPWIFKQTREIFDGKEPSPKPNMDEQLKFFSKHADLATEMKGEEWAMIELRKHFAAFVRGVVGATKFRERLIRVKNREEMDQIFKEIRENL